METAQTQLIPVSLALSKLGLWESLGSQLRLKYCLASGSAPRIKLVTTLPLIFCSEWLLLSAASCFCLSIASLEQSVPVAKSAVRLLAGNAFPGEAGASEKRWCQATALRPCSTFPAHLSLSFLI